MCRCLFGGDWKSGRAQITKAERMSGGKAKGTIRYGARKANAKPWKRQKPMSESQISLRSRTCEGRFRSWVYSRRMGSGAGFALRQREARGGRGARFASPRLKRRGGFGRLILGRRMLILQS